MQLHTSRITPWHIVFGTFFIMLMTFSFSSQVSAHGYVSQPESRALLCKQEVNKNCGSVIYEPQSLEAPGNFPSGGPADGKIASANTFLELDAQSSARWKKVPMKSGNNKFNWTLKAQHVTSTWDYYITRTGWDTNKPLKRADLQKFCTVDDKMKKPAAKVTHTCKVPERSGYHVILAVWNIGDTKNAFYNVIDADFSGKQVKPTEPDKKPDVKPVVPSKPVPETKPNARDWNFKSTYTAGNEVIYKGVSYKAQWWTSGDTPGKSDVWKLTKTATINPKNWNKTQTYVARNQAMLGKSLYEAKWWTRGDLPGSSDVWKLVKPANTNVLKWNKTNAYVGGDKVTYNGVIYEAKWWTRGNVPSNSTQWKRK